MLHYEMTGELHTIQVLMYGQLCCFQTFKYSQNRNPIQDYMSNVNGKEILLQYVTVKVPGRNPRGLKRISQTKVTL